MPSVKKSRQQALIQTENPKAQASAELTLNLTKAQLLGWLAGHGLDGIDYHGDANVLTTLMSLLDDPDSTQVDSTDEIPAGKDNLCTILYVANGCDDRQFSLVVRIGGAPSDAPMPCQGDSSNIFGLILVLDRNGNGGQGGPGRARGAGLALMPGTSVGREPHDEELSLTPARSSLRLFSPHWRFRRIEGCPRRGA